MLIPRFAFELLEKLIMKSKIKKKCFNRERKILTTKSDDITVLQLTKSSK